MGRDNIGVRIFNFLYVFSFLNKKVPWTGRENKPKPWQPINLQKYNKEKRKYNNT